ncbi:MAG: hypothetical protein AAF558_03685 [Verrucomicrobiota bacterium]
MKTKGLKSIQSIFGLVALIAIPMAVCAESKITTADGNGADTMVRGGNHSAKNSGGAGVIVPKGGEPIAFHRKAIVRFDLSAVSPEGAAKLVLKVAVKNGAPKSDVPLEIYGVKDGVDLDEAPEKGGWSEGTEKNQASTDPAAISWDAIESALGMDLVNLSSGEKLVKLGNATVPTGGDTLEFSSEKLTDWVKSDQNQLVTLIISASSNAGVSFMTKEWNVDVAPALLLSSAN